MKTINSQFDKKNILLKVRKKYFKISQIMFFHVENIKLDLVVQEQNIMKLKEDPKKIFWNFFWYIYENLNINTLFISMQQTFVSVTKPASWTVPNTQLSSKLANIPLKFCFKEHVELFGWVKRRIKTENISGKKLWKTVEISSGLIKKSGFLWYASNPSFLTRAGEKLT